MSIEAMAGLTLAQQNYQAAATQTTSSSSSTSSSTSSSSAYSKLDANDFFKLLVAQLQNQDIMNPVSDTEFISQMAQFSALSATQELANKFSNFMAVSYVGKTVTAVQNGVNGQTTITGVVESVEFSGNQTLVNINGTKIPADQITKISA